MAWTSKADRFSGPGALLSTSLSGTAGPGAYKTEKQFAGTEHGYAPFGSTDPRLTSSKDARDGSGPPPGTYDPKLPSSFDSGLPRKHVAFGVGATRIESKHKQDPAPGPGSYGVPDLRQEGAPEACRTMGVVGNNMAILRSSSAPSIPTTQQSYGYEEVGGGRLVRQGPKDASLWCTGRLDDSTGPGHYTINADAVKARQTHGAFMRAPARVPLGARDTPGPGHYAAKTSLEIQSSSYLGSSSFVSAGPRGQTKRQEQREADGPGPGQYAQANSRKADLRELRSELQYFGSTTERFKQAPDKSGAAPHVGPGSYSSQPRRPDVYTVRSFCSTDQRFRDKAPETAPGPGAYEAPGLTDEGGGMSTFSMLANSGGLAFGAMSKRLQTYDADARPGPGDYMIPGMSDDAAEPTIPIPEDSKGRPRWRKPSRLPGAAFASKTPKDAGTRTAIREGQMRPPPGAYDPVLVKDQSTVVRLRSKSEGFLSGMSDRFQGGPLEAPKASGSKAGPGSYVIQDITGGKRAGTFNRSMLEGMPASGRPKGLGFTTQEKRFKTSSLGNNAKAPGPGQYHTSQNWVTKSHNCYFGDLM